jgi:hypothetical protein
VTTSIKEKGMSMKLFSCVQVLSMALALVACDSNSKKSSESDHEGHADAAMSAEESAACAAHHEGMGLHGDLSGYTMSAQGHFHVKVAWSSPLQANSLENKATVSFVNEHAEALPLKLSSFKLFMPAMGHGSNKSDQMVLTQDPEQKHVWTVEQIHFSMGGGAGEWVVDIEGSGCGVSDKARVVIPLEVQ